MLCTTCTILDIFTANSLHLISPAGSDYTPVTTDLTFNSTNAAIPQTVTIPILDDLLLEGSEGFNVTLTSNVTLLPNLATLTIEDVEGKLKKDWLFNHTVVASYPGSSPLLKEEMNLGTKLPLF